MKADTEKFENYAAHGHWSNWDRMIDRRDDLMQLTIAACGDIVPGARLTTRELTAHMFPGMSQLGIDYVQNGLMYLRKHGMLPGLWSQRQRKHQRIDWMNPNSGEDDFPVGFMS